LYHGVSINYATACPHKEIKNEKMEERDKQRRRRRRRRKSGGVIVNS
jgi:hypothetical protein